MKLLLLIFFSLSPFFSATAEFFIYQNEDGNQVYVDSLEKVPPQYRGSVKSGDNLPKISKGKANNYQVPSLSPYFQKKQSKIEVFVTAWCGYCRKLEDFLNRERIPFTKLDIEKNLAAKKRYESLSLRGVPVTLVDGEIIRGYQPEMIQALLKR
jgi:glutaredoxin